MTPSPARPPGLPLSVVVITLNAGAQLGQCLASVAFADDIVVLDAGSTDSTLDIALRAGARVTHGEWPGFGIQKQRAVALARHDWVLCLDADERVSDPLREAIVAALDATPRFSAWRR